VPVDTAKTKLGGDVDFAKPRVSSVVDTAESKLGGIIDTTELPAMKPGASGHVFTCIWLCIHMHLFMDPHVLYMAVKVHAHC
jgi:hypothetical protein